MCQASLSVLVYITRPYALKTHAIEKHSGMRLFENLLNMLSNFLFIERIWENLYDP